MKIASTLLLAAAALALGWVAWRAPEPSYVPPDPAAGIPRALPTAAPAGLELRRFRVEGMCCEGCPAKLYERLVEVEGVTAAALDHDKGEAMVYAAPGADAGALLAALNWDKYTAEPLP